MFPALWAAASGALLAQKESDDLIYDLVRRRLTSDPEVKGANLQVEVKDGAVTLKGVVPSEKAKSKAEKVTKKVKGVKSVSNQLQVRS